MTIGGSYSSKQKGPRAVWTWYALAVLLVLATGFGWLTQQPWDIPDEGELSETGGDIARFYVLDDVFESSAGAFLPILGSAYIHFKDQPGRYRFPWTHAGYEAVRRDFGINATVWVRTSDLAGDPETRDAPKIWGIAENNPYKDEDFPQVVVTPAQMIAAKRSSAGNLYQNTFILLGLAVVAVIVGRKIGRANRRDFPAHYGIRPEP